MQVPTMHMPALNKGSEACSLLCEQVRAAAGQSECANLQWTKA